MQGCFLYIVLLYILIITRRMHLLRLNEVIYKFVKLAARGAGICLNWSIDIPHIKCHVSAYLLPSR